MGDDAPRAGSAHGGVNTEKTAAAAAAAAAAGRRLRPGSKQLTVATCSICTQDLAYLERGQRLSSSPRVVFLEEALLRGDPFATTEGALPMQVGAVCSLCSSVVCMGRECSLFYTRRFCRSCAIDNVQHLPPEVVRLESQIFSSTLCVHIPNIQFQHFLLLLLLLMITVSLTLFYSYSPIPGLHVSAETSSKLQSAAWGQGSGGSMMRRTKPQGSCDTSQAASYLLIFMVPAMVVVWIWKADSRQQQLLQHAKVVYHQDSQGQSNHPEIAEQVVHLGETTRPGSSSQSHAQSSQLEVSCAAGPLGGGRPHVELEGSVVRSGWERDGTGLSAPNAAACCQECLALRGCNIWVHSMHNKQCWLKHQDNPRDPIVRGEGRSIPWTSGALLKAFLDPDEPVQEADPAMDSIVLSTAEGDIRLRLRSDWSASSVDYLRRVAAMPDDSCINCQLYRVEPQFLLQGVIRTLLPANKITTPGPKIMEMGEVGWAGGGPGPDFFIYLGEQPAQHFGHDHTVWAEVADAESLATAQRIVALPSETPGGPGTMRFLIKKLQLSVRGA